MLSIREHLLAAGVVAHRSRSGVWSATRTCYSSETLRVRAELESLVRGIAGVRLGRFTEHDALERPRVHVALTFTVASHSPSTRAMSALLPNEAAAPELPAAAAFLSSGALAC